MKRHIIPGRKSLEIWEKEKGYMTTGLAPCTLYTPIVFERGEGALLWDVDGNRYIDLAAGVLTNSTGHCHPIVVERLGSQLKQLWHVHDFPTPDRYRLCELLREITPEGIDTFEFYSGGTETVEAAMRAAASYNRGKSLFLSFHQCYHGKTLGSRSLTQNRDFGPVPDGIRVPFAYCYRCAFGQSYPGCNMRCADYMEETIRKHKNSLCAAVTEPVLGAGGVIVPPQEFLKRLESVCRETGVLLIADEVLTGIGRTGGTFFTVQSFDIKPDLICSGKGLGSGFPVMALGGRREIMTAEPYGSPGGASTSFGGNPLAVAAALVTLEVIRDEGMLEHAERVGDYMEERLRAMQEKHPLIGDVRGMGALFGVELVTDRETREPADEAGRRVYLECVGRGLKILTTGSLSRFSPPLNIPFDLLNEALDIYEAALTAVEESLI